MAHGLEREHKSVLQLINDFKDKFEYFGVLKTQKLKSTYSEIVIDFLLLKKYL